MPKATLTSKGQTTIPREIREYLHLSPGDRLDFVIEDGQVVIRSATLDVRDLKGILRRTDGVVVSIEEMNAAIARGATGESE